MRLKSAIFNNLYSFGQGVSVSFPWESETAKTLIVGQNNDEPGADSNGAGKSNILNSVYWIIFGEVFQEEGADDIIRKGEKWCSGTAEFINPETRGTLVISRGRGTGAKKFLKVSVNGEDKTCNTDTETQKVILTQMHIPTSAKSAEYLNDFINTVYFSSDVVKGFLGKKTTSKDRFAVIERFLGLKRFSLAGERAKTKKKELLEKVEKHMSAIAGYEIILQQKTEAQFLFEIDEAKKEKATQEELVAQKELIIAGQREITQLETDIAQTKALIEQTKSTFTVQMTSLEKETLDNEAKVVSLNQAITDYQNQENIVTQQKADAEQAMLKKSELDKLITDLSQTNLLKSNAVNAADIEISSITNQIKSHHLCPACNAPLMITNGQILHANTDTLKAKLLELTAKKEGHTKELAKVTADIGTYQKQQEALSESINNYSSNKNYLDRLVKPENRQAEITALNKRNADIIVIFDTLTAEAQEKVATLKAALSTKEQTYATVVTGKTDTTLLQQQVIQGKQAVSTHDQAIGSLSNQLTARRQTEQLWKDENKKAEEIKALADIQGFWEVGFNEIKLNIIDEFLPDFEVKVNEYLEKMRVSLRVSFDTQKEKANASKKDKEMGRAYKEEFFVEVFKEDGIPIPYGLLSKGQRGRAGTCVGMALRELIQERGNSVFDFFFLDEIADALDNSGLRELVNLLDNTPGQKLVISHNDFLKDFFDEKITVEMTNEVSTIKQESIG